MNKISIRPARESDLQDIAAIHTYYVLNTVITFSEEPLLQEKFLSTYQSIVSQGLPYLVAFDEPTSSVLGYANAHGFRGMKGAYRHTVEISLFCHPDHQGMGVGSLLLEKLISVLRDPTEHPGLRQAYSRCEPNTVKAILAVMAVDETGKGNGLKLKEFYERFGFVLRGHLHGVGYKFDRWIDTMYLQLSF